MAKTLRFVCVFLFILGAALPSAFAAGRGISDKKTADVKQPQFLLGHEGTVLIPGFGRVVIPPKKGCKGRKVNPFNYNPITGRSGYGTGAENPLNGVFPFPGTGTGGVGYIPGGDDTLVPNPGVEVPIGGGGGGLPAPPARH